MEAYPDNDINFAAMNDKGNKECRKIRSEHAGLVALVIDAVEMVSRGVVWVLWLGQ